MVYGSKIDVMKSGNSESIHAVAELELVRAKSAIEQFIYSCSHTMRGPLKSISGLVYLLKNAENSKEVDRGYCLHSIEQTVEKLESVLNGLEQFLTTLSMDITSQSIDATEFIEDIISEFQDTISENNISIEVGVKQSVRLYTDRARFRAILSHLISNAIVFQDSGKEAKQITISVKIDLTNCTVKVKDNGIGIPADIKSNIFQLFYRGSDKSRGAGVGLYVAKEMLNKMGGTISLRSKPRVGSSFTFTIPNLSV
jgi:hypothetical protein